MNERVNELAEQCYITGPLTRDGWPEYTKFDEQKFAKLLIRECTDTLWELHSESKDRHNWFGIAAAKLDEHFGIEE